MTNVNYEREGIKP